jgi:cellobiose-specific phosphotransferase system component IIC
MQKFIGKTMLERIVAIVLIILLVLIGNPFMFWMPSMMLVSVLVVIAALVFAWAGFIFTETATDEREEWHRTHAGRAAYLSAAAILTIALVYQGFTHKIDFWIPLTLAVMVVAKLFARFYADTYR